MQITINKKVYDLHFGFDFLEEVNKYFGLVIDVEGQEVNTKSGGLNFMLNGLEQYDPIALIKTIRCATSTEKSKPSKADLEAHVMELLNDDEKYDAFLDELLAEIKKSPLINAMSKRAKEQ